MNDGWWPTFFCLVVIATIGSGSGGGGGVHGKGPHLIVRHELGGGFKNESHIRRRMMIIGGGGGRGGHLTHELLYRLNIVVIKE